jgi:uncharacterized spore protein YtfJ
MLDTDTTGAEPIRDTMRGTRDALNVKRVFGEAYDLDGVTIIPVARVAGGAGGGGGEGSEDGDDGEGAASGGGFGTGFGMGVTPLGVYEVRGETVTWKPSVDVNRVVKGGQTLTAIIAVCLTIVLIARR